ncbi:MAG: flagellar motor switch protein FliM, partial [Clostridia bacterium]|nr:flagellar motor switch protein FliM [Clostridia bacterium]
ANVLSQQQIDELLGNLQSGELNIDQVEEQQTTQKIKEYDFRSPRKVTKDQLKYLTNIFDNFARFFSMKLTSVLRQNCQIEIIQIEEEEYKEFNNALSDSVLVGMFGMTCEKAKIQDEQILLEIAKPLSFAIMDLLLGGSGVKVTNIDRDYTDIELSIMEYVFKMMLPHLNNAWSNYLEVAHTLDVIETNSRVIQFVPPDVTIAIIVIEISIEDVQGIMNLCIPTTLFEKLFPLLGNRMAKKGDDKQEEQKSNIFTSIKKTGLDITGLLGSTDIEIQDLLELQKGDIIILNERKISDDVEVMVEDSPWFIGKIGVQNKNYSIKISKGIN